MEEEKKEKEKREKKNLILYWLYANLYVIANPWGRKDSGIENLSNFHKDI